MYSNNPRLDRFSVTISDDFYIPEIVDKYNSIIETFNYPIDNIKDIIAESIQGFETNDFATNIAEQSIKTNEGGNTAISPPNQTDTQNLDLTKTVTITLRHIDGQLNYYCLMEHYFARIKTGVENPNRKPFVGITHTKANSLNTVWVDTIYRDCQMATFPKIVSNSTNIQGDFDTIVLDFKYNNFSTEIYTNDLKYIYGL